MDTGSGIDAAPRLDTGAGAAAAAAALGRGRSGLGAGSGRPGTYAFRVGQCPTPRLGFVAGIRIQIDAGVEIGTRSSGCAGPVRSTEMGRGEGRKRVFQ